MITPADTAVPAGLRGSAVQGLKTLLLVTAFALAIFGCGGGGGGTASSSVDSGDSGGSLPPGSEGSGGSLLLGALVHDGPATPEQIALFLPVTGPLPQTATAARLQAPMLETFAGLERELLRYVDLPRAPASFQDRGQEAQVDRHRDAAGAIRDTLVDKVAQYDTILGREPDVAELALDHH